MKVSDLYNRYIVIRLYNKKIIYYIHIDTMELENHLRPYKISDIDVSKIRYSYPKTKDNKKIIFINYENKSLVFQTPYLNIINKSVIDHDKKTNNIENHYEVDVAIKDDSNNLSVFLNNLEDKIIKDANENTKWFDKDNTKESKIEKLINYSAEYDTKYLNFKLIETNNFKTKLLANNNEIIFNDIIIDTKVITIVEVFGVWINSANNYGIFLRPILMSFESNKSTNYNYTLLSDETELSNNYIPLTEIATIKNKSVSHNYHLDIHNSDEDDTKIKDKKKNKKHNDKNNAVDSVIHKNNTVDSIIDKDNTVDSVMDKDKKDKKDKKNKKNDDKNIIVINNRSESSNNDDNGTRIILKKSPQIKSTYIISATSSS